MWRAKRSALKSAQLPRFAASFALSDASSAGSSASLKAIASYSASDPVISSGTPTARSRLAATRPGKVVPSQVSSGRPAHNASFPVVCAL